MLRLACQITQQSLLSPFNNTELLIEVELDEGIAIGHRAQDATASCPRRDGALSIRTHAHEVASATCVRGAGQEDVKQYQ